MPIIDGVLAFETSQLISVRGEFYTHAPAPARVDWVIEGGIVTMQSPLPFSTPNSFLSPQRPYVYSFNSSSLVPGKFYRLVFQVYYDDLESPLTASRDFWTPLPPTPSASCVFAPYSASSFPQRFTVQCPAWSTPAVNVQLM